MAGRSPPHLFQPVAVGGLTLPNRIVIAPMCQYSAVDGCMTDWHMIHLGQLAQSGAGLLTIEATAVLPDGRITRADTGLWDDVTQAAMDRVLRTLRRWSSMPVAIQLGHAGRKASQDLLWNGGRQIAPDARGGWQTLAPSPIPWERGENAPRALDRADMDEIRGAFAASARRAALLGIDAIQLHGAHGYLLHQFLSPLSNRRSDAYGGSLSGRMRFPLEIFDAVRAAFPADRPVTMRVSATDWVPGGWDIDQTIAFAQALEARGCSALHVSSGGLDARQDIPVSPGYQVPFARAIRRSVRMPVVAVGLITGFDQAEAILAAGDADLVGIARTILYDPRWPWHAAEHFGVGMEVAEQYLFAASLGNHALFTPRHRGTPRPDLAR